MPKVIIPVSPSDLRELAFTQAELMDTIDKINKALIEHTRRGSALQVSGPFITGMTVPLREAVIREYEKMGWSVKFHDSQRDGPWLDFAELDNSSCESSGRFDDE